MEEEIQNLKLEVAELTAHNDDLSTNLTKLTKESEKEKAILTQKIDFLQTQLDEAGEQSQGTMKSHDALLRAVKAAEYERDAAISESEVKVEEV